MKEYLTLYSIISICKKPPHVHGAAFLVFVLILLLALVVPVAVLAAVLAIVAAAVLIVVLVIILAVVLIVVLVVVLVVVHVVVAISCHSMVPPKKEMFFVTGVVWPCFVFLCKNIRYH